MKKYLLLHSSFFVFSLSGIFSKLASKYDFFSFNFCLCYGLMLFILFVYAILWQQTLKKIDLSIAYANKAIMIIWSTIWGITIFNETLEPKHFLAAILIIIGVILVSYTPKKKRGDN